MRDAFFQSQKVKHFIKSESTFISLLKAEISNLSGSLFCLWQICFLGLFIYSHFGCPGGNWGENKWLLMKQTSATATYDKLY